MKRLWWLLLVCLMPGLARGGYYQLTLNLAPCHWYRMDATSGTAETDITNLGNPGCGSQGAVNGAYANGFTLNQTGISGASPSPAVAFDGSSGTYMRATPAPDGEGPDTTNGQGWSVTAWVKTSSTIGYIATSYNTSVGPDYSWYLYNDHGALLGAMKTNNGTPDCITTSWAQEAGSNLNNGSYHMVGMTSVGAGSGTIANAKVYMDGALLFTVTSFAADGKVCSARTYFGVAQLDNTDRLTGSIDEVTFWRYELDAPKMLALYDCGSASLFCNDVWPYAKREPPPFPTPKFFAGLLNEGHVKTVGFKSPLGDLLLGGIKETYSRDEWS